MFKGTINFNEISKFSNLAKEWWNERGNEAKMLHKMNPLRLEYILNHSQIKNHKVLEVGCGGGILSIPLARVGANLTAIEPSTSLYEVAIKKAKEEGLDINFINSSIEECKEGDFDTILLIDVLEHVENAERFLQEVQNRLKVGGSVVVSTINKTIFSKIFVKFFAEDVIKIIPKGTHEFNKFISPDDVCKMLPSCKQFDLCGFIYNPVRDGFKLTKSTQMNYFLSLKKL